MNLASVQISYLIVDEVHENHPDLMKDAYWEEVVPDELPYTEAAKPTHHSEPFMGSTRYVDVPMDQRNFILMSMFAESEVMSVKTVMSGTVSSLLPSIKFILINPSIYT